MRGPQEYSISSFFVFCIDDTTINMDSISTFFFFYFIDNHVYVYKHQFITVFVCSMKEMPYNKIAI